MDLREKKTRRAIHNAFLQLRKAKPLERITVKELAELAQISKATFYLHYRDIYDLSERLQNQVIQDILASIPSPALFLQDQAAFSQALCSGFHAQQNLIDTLFSGSQFPVLPMRVEEELLHYIHQILPPDPRLDMLLTYQIQGAFHVFQRYHRENGSQPVMELIGDLSRLPAGYISEKAGG